MEKTEAEALLRYAATEMPANAIGLLQWEETECHMTPLVFVRTSGTMIWETACGSGTAAIGAWKTLKAERSTRITIGQPGGKLTVETENESGKIRRIRLTGSIRIGETETL